MKWFKRKPQSQPRAYTMSGVEWAQYVLDVQRIHKLIQEMGVVG